MSNRMTIGRRRFVEGALASGAMLCAPHVARAQDWPNRPVRFIVHLAAGGGLDFIARVVGEPISRSIGQQVFVENRTGGAGGTIGIDAGIKAPNDGYNFLIANDNIVSAPHVQRLGVD
jgi:tripartite-type tricarboxylate transporter receptor subunit TctC